VVTSSGSSGSSRVASHESSVETIFLAPELNEDLK
jgi:hypothetical protein